MAAHTCRGWRGLSMGLLVALWPAAVRAQGLSEPLSLANGRIVISGDLAASGAPDDLGFFNYSDYEHSTLREVRVGLAAEIRITRRVSVLGELRTGNLSAIRPFSLFLRVQPWQGRNVNIQVGRIPPTFGAYTRRAYSRDNPLIGYPMAYQYLTSLRPDAVPVSADDLLRMRGRGWLSGFSAGAATLDRGVPLVTVFSRDTGAQVTAGWRALELSASVTTGSPANPQLNDGNRGATMSARAAIKPAPGVALGVSYAGGAFLRKALTDLGGAVPGSESQRVGGVDLEVAGGRWPLAGKGRRGRERLADAPAGYTRPHQPAARDRHRGGTPPDARPGPVCGGPGRAPVLQHRHNQRRYNQHRHDRHARRLVGRARLPHRSRRGLLHPAQCRGPCERAVQPP